MSPISPMPCPSITLLAMKPATKPMNAQTSSAPGSRVKVMVFAITLVSCASYTNTRVGAKSPGILKLAERIRRHCPPSVLSQGLAWPHGKSQDRVWRQDHHQVRLPHQPHQGD